MDRPIINGKVGTRARAKFGGSPLWSLARAGSPFCPGRIGPQCVAGHSAQYKEKGNTNDKKRRRVDLYDLYLAIDLAEDMGEWPG